MSDYRCPICKKEHIKGGFLIDLGGFLDGDVVVCENEKYVHLIRKRKHIIARVLQYQKLNVKQLVLN